MIQNYGRAEALRNKRLAQQQKQTVRKTIAQQRRSLESSQSNMELLYACANDFAKWDYIRRNRRRILAYKNGDQWGELVYDPDTGKYIREDLSISKAGKTPLKHNLIQNYFKNIHGQRDTNPSQSIVTTVCADESDLGDMLTNSLQAVQHLNDADTLDQNVLEELLSAGIAIVKLGYDFWSEKEQFDGTIKLVNINRFCTNPDFEDPRLKELYRMTEIHDYTFDELEHNFAKSPADSLALKELYAQYRKGTSPYMHSSLTPNASTVLENMDFFGYAEVDKCRVIEVWEKLGRWVLYVHDRLDGTEEIYESGLSMADIEAINKKRIAEATAVGIAEADVRTIYAEQRHEWYWNVKFLTPTGVCLREMETPYAHQEHPYVFAHMPIVDGVITPVLVDLIDLQRYINRLIIMIDFIMSASAKGVLAIPEDCIAKASGWKLEDYTKEWVKSNGVILVAKNPTGQMPQQIAANSTNIGAWEMLKLELDLMSQISGLSGAIQGQVSKPGTAASLYAQQAQNSMLNYVLTFNRMDKYQEKRDEKLLKILMDKYDEPHYIDINGDAFTETAKVYQPQLAKKIRHWYLRVSRAKDTPVLRQLAEESILELVKMGAVPFEVYLKNSSLPYADKILSEIKQFNEQAQQVSSSEQLLQLMSQAGTSLGQPTSDQQASMALLQQLLRGAAPMQRSAA